MENELTQSAQQTIKFFSSFIRRKKVVDFITQYRARLNLPSNGLTLTDKDRKEISMFPFIFIPSSAITLFPEIIKKKPAQVINTCIIFAKQQGVESVYIKAMLSLYLFFDQIIDTPLRALRDSNDFLKLEHIPSELSWFNSDDEELLRISMTKNIKNTEIEYRP